MPITAHRFVAVQYIYHCFAMGVVENVLRKAKERAARASAKISGSNAVKFGPKIGIRSLLIKFKTCLYSYNEKVKMVLYSNAGTFFTSARFLGTLEVLGYLIIYLVIYLNIYLSNYLSNYLIIQQQSMLILSQSVTDLNSCIRWMVANSTSW